ncbi:MAG: endonuclease, partial [Roseobacter sp.]
MVKSPTPGALRIATYNVHYIIVFKETGPWSVGDWERRKTPLDLAFKEINGDVIAFQEMESFGGRSGSDVNLTLDWLLENNSEYGAAAVGDPKEFPSTQPILYRRDRLELQDQGWFFFSETPDVIYARTFNGS